MANRILIILAVVWLLCLSFFAVLALDSEYNGATNSPDDVSLFVGNRVDSAMDYSTLGPFDQAQYDALTARMVPSGDTMPGYGLRYFEGGRMWMRLIVPKLETSLRERVLRLNDSRVRDARLVVVSDTGFREQEWLYNSPDRKAGLGARVPVFRFLKEEIEGKTVLIGFNSLGALRANLYLETEGAYHAKERSNALQTMITGGFLMAIAIYLGIMAAVLRDRVILLLGGFSFFFGVFIFGGQGYFHTVLLPGIPVLANVLLYGAQPLVIALPLLFFSAFIDLPRKNPRLAGFIAVLAGLEPFHGILLLARDYYQLSGPLWFDNSIAVVTGLVVLLGSLLWYVLRGDRQAIRFLLCFSPILVFTIGRLVAYWLHVVDVHVMSILDSYYDIPLTMALFAVAVMSDVPKRERLLRTAAEENEGRFRRYAEIASDSFFEVGRDGQVSRASGSVTQAIGLAAGSLFADLLRRLDPASAKNITQLSFAGGAVRNLEVQYREQDGSDRWLSFNIVGRDGMLTGTISDISERVVARKQESRRSTLAALGQLASGVAHEVNNLLHPMINLGRHVRDRRDQDAESRRLLDIVVTSGEHAGRIVANVLTTFGPGHDIGEKIAWDVALGQAVEGVQATLPISVSLDLRIEPCSVEPVSLGEVLQVISNLASNAVRAMGGAGHIQIALTPRPEGGAELRFEDNGPGFPADIIDRAFDPFVSGRQEGTGLGLSQVANLVHHWKGTIEIDRTFQEGTRFVITLPNGAA